jgi:hypothetical protein
MLIFLNLYCVLGMELNFLSISQITRHNPQLDADFSNQKYYIVDKETKKTVSLDVKDHRLLRLMDIG